MRVAVGFLNDKLNVIFWLKLRFPFELGDRKGFVTVAPRSWPVGHATIWGSPGVGDFQPFQMSKEILEWRPI